MNRHQVLTGAANAGDHCYSVGSVEGVPFTAYASGCNIVILASNFQRIQIIPGLIHGNVQVGCLDASTDVGKIAAAYGKEVCIFEPTPLLHLSSNHRLDYQWVQTAVIKSEFQLQVLSWNLSGTRLLTGGSNIQLWQLSIAGEDDIIEEEPTNIQVKCTGDDGVVTDIDEQCKWNCIWSCRTAQSVAFLKFSPDGTLFASAGTADRLVKIWYSSKIVSFSSQHHSGHSGAVNYTFIYIAHPRAVSGLSWRKTSKFMPKDSVANMLLTSCRDNICRIWVQSLMPEDGLVDLQQIDSIANQNLRVQTQRHRKKIMQRLKHMKSFNQLKKHQASQFTEDPHEPISILPSTYSVHDFHCFGMQGSGITPSLHFHLAGTIDAKTDIPLVPSLVGGHTKDPNFVVHWMNNKEMAFTHAAEHLLQDVSDKVLQLQHKRDMACLDHDSDKLNSENKVLNGRRSSHPKSESSENINEPLASKQNSPSASSSTSIATDSSTSQSQSISGDFIDRKIEKLLRDWHRSQDLLFSVYPADGSFLVWSVDWLDEYHPGSFRQAIVNFASRIPNAVPLGDATTMSHNIFMYSPHAGLDLRLAISAAVSEQMIKDKTGKNEEGDAEEPPVLDYSQWKHNCNKQLSQYCALSSTTPTVCMLTKHSNGSLNLWHVSFADISPYTQVLSIGHFTRVCGHRFRINDVTCHPVLPLLLTTSHHNLPGQNQNSNPPTPAASLSPRCCFTPLMGLQSGFCSELILWKVDPVGPLSKSGGVTELARINSPETAAFANVAWIPTLLPSTTQGSISNSPSACFVASDGHQLRVYQAVIDARTLLAEISSSSRRKNSQDMSQSTSTSSGLGYKHSTLQDTFRIISEQSTSRPGCVIELDSITDATHDWQNTQLLHVFQEQLISSSPHRRNIKEASNISLVQPDLQAIVDLRHSSVFEEPFYLVVLEKQEEKSVLHMWKIIIASPFGAEDHEHQSFSYVPDSNLVQESDHSNQSSRSISPDHNHDAYPLSQVSPLRITTVKVCTQVMPLPDDVEIVHATPAAGHLSSSNIYPACFAPYLICTACSDYTVRFWKCEIIETGNKDEVEYNWVEWEMMLNKSPSSVRVSGQPLFVSCAYSGRMACAFKHGKSFTRHNSKNPESRFVNIGVSIFECESTGGSEWMLEDTINLRNVSLPVPKLSLNLESLVDASQRNKRTADTLLQKLSTDETANERLPLQRLLSVPSYATLQTLRQTITEKGNQDLLAPKSLVQLDWVSAEDGSHILTVAIGSKVLLFSPVSNDIAQANVQAMKASKSASRPLLKQASSMVLPLSCNDEIRWMRIRSTPLKTADSLPPIPMQLSWVRHGILVVGMDSEMHIYSQWRVPVSNERGQAPESEKDEPLVDDRKLTEEELLARAQESSQLRLPTTSGTLSRSTSSNVLTAAADTKRKKSEVAKPQRESIASVGPMPDFGLFEASRLACPILPQYHPKQLMELLGFGKLRRVKAILSHLVRCLSGSENIKKTYLQVPESVGNEDEGDETTRTWSRTRAMSMAASSSPLPHSPNDQRGSVSVFPEEVTLDYVEIQSIPPLPLFTLIAADKELHQQPVQSTQETTEALDQDYSGLFDVSMHMEDSLDDILHSKSVSGENKKDRPSFSGNEKKANLTNFSPNQAASLTHFLTHSHLPGLSSLDQMHLLALADTVASFNTALSDRFGAEPVVSKGPNKTNVEGLNVTVTTDSLDDCGLRFLLAVRHYVYLTLCLPLSQRAQLQNQGLGSHSLVWAFHSETQEELLQLIPCMQKGTLKWSELRELGIGWWVRSNTVLRRLMEKVAKAAFQSKNDPMDAALYYLAMKKKTLLWGLFRSVSDSKMTAFFQNNFTQDKWKKSAMKNAYVLMGKQRFEHAAAFFLLGGDLKVAVEIILNHLNDLQLAMVVIRLHEGEIETVTPSLKKLLFVEVLGCEPEGNNYIPSKAYPDPFIRCMARWILQDYCGSLTTLLQTDVGYSHPKAAEIENSGDRMSANPSVFNFYLFLRTHPLVVRRQRAQNLSELKKSKAAGKQNFQSESLDIEEAPFEDTITPLERRLFFTTAHAHFRAGCPALALEVLSRLPNRVLTDGPMSPDDAVFDFANVINEDDNVIASGLVNQDSISQTASKTMDWGQPVVSSAGGGSAADFDWSQPTIKKTEETLDLDWGAPVSQPKELELELDFGLNASENEVSEEEEDGIEIKAPEEPVKEEVKNDSRSVAIDIMAQQLKFIACLKIMMEELSTLATGYEVDGGQLRYQLYIWLEKSVSALKDLCLYGACSQDYDEAVNEESMAMDGSSHSNANWDSALDFSNQRASLHEILLADKLDFEAKLQRASRRKQWLKANEALLRTLLSYCSLHGAHGGGLAAVRMELILLLHELQQERSRQQLLSPLPFPTTLPLLAASVACQKTVVADPIRHLQSLVHDILLTIIDMTDPPTVSNASFSHLVVLRDLSTSLSACIYESLCDSDTFVVKQGGARGLSMEELISSGVVYQNSHLLAGHTNRIRHSSGEEDVKATTSPHKWPGVSSLRALLAQDKDEDTPKLHTLLCEAFVSVFVSQLIYALSTCDCHVLYRLVGQCFSKETWALLFGGGAKMLLHISTTTTTNSIELSGSPASLEKESQSQNESGSGILDSLSRQRIKFHMKLLGQSGQQTTQPVIKEDKPTYREQFIPPKMSMVSLFMSKPKLVSEWNALDYDSNASLPSDEEEVEEGEMDDVFGGENADGEHHATSGRKKITSDSGLEQLDPSSYTWGILRYAVVKLARNHIVNFLSIAGLEMQDLPVVSPLIHAVLKCMDFWIKDLKQYMDSFESPPPNYIPGCSFSGPQIGPAALKYSALLDLHNTPFRSCHRAVLPVKRLWNYLVRQESVQDVFIRYIYQFKRAPKTDDFDIDAPAEGNSTNLNSVRVIHKDQDTINTFCINRVKNGIIALATPKEIQEIDMSVLLQPVPWLREEAEFEAVNLLRAPDTLPATDYLVIQHPADALQGNQSSSGSTPTTSGPTSSIGASKNLKKHKIDGVRKLTSHPLMPVYLSGSQDGSVSLWEWNHAHPISSPRQAGTFAKVTKIAFNLQGNKFGVTDGDGIISLWQVGLGSVSNKPFFSTQCHSKQANDFAFLSSSSLIATAGHSTDNRNVCLWDTLLPQGKSLIASFQCHDGGCSSLVYAPQSHTLISAGKKGDICIFDVRQNKLKQKFQAHESPIKCLALDPAEEFFATGSADGDIKVWGLSVHVKLCTFNGEHTKSSLFRSINNGVSQLEIDEMGRLFSCGADGSLKFRTLPDNDIVNVL